MNQDATRQAEAALIGSLLKNPLQYPVIRDIVRADDFHDIGFQAIFKAIGELHESSLSIDTVMVGDMLDRKGELQDVAYEGFTSRTAINRIRDDGERGNAESYAVTVWDYSAKRKMVEEFSKGANWALNGRHAHDIQADMMNLLASIPTPNHKAEKHTQTLSEVMSDAWDEANNPRDVVKTGFIDLDGLLSGLRSPDFIIVAARPGQGKTTLLDNIAHNVAKQGKCVVIFSLEMANVQNGMRLIQAISGVSYQSQRDGKMTAEEWERFSVAVQELEKLNIHLCDLPSITPGQIRKTLRTIQAKHKIDLVIVDYIQLANPDDKKENRVLEVGEVSRQFKQICKEFDVPMLAAAQLSRAIEQRSDKRPVLSDLRESGSLEQDSDVVMFIYRPDQYEKETTRQNIAEIIVAKHRNGPVGSIELIFRSALTKFENASTRHFDPNHYANRE